MPDVALRSLLVSFATEIPGKALEQEMGPLKTETVGWRERNIEAGIRSRCCGLLETHKLSWWQSENQWDQKAENTKVAVLAVEDLHRTVAEFLHADDVW